MAGVFLATGLKTVGRMGDTNCLASLSVPFNAQDHSYICTTNIDACVSIMKSNNNYIEQMTPWLIPIQNCKKITLNIQYIQDFHKYAGHWR